MWGGLPTCETDRWIKTTPADPHILKPTLTWEGPSLQEASVLPPSTSPDGNWWLYYRGGNWSNSPQPLAIGLATCPSGSDPTVAANWTKHSGNPVFNPGEALEFMVFSQGATSGTFYAIYNTGGLGATNNCFRYASCTDGLSWADKGQALAPTASNWWYLSGSPGGGNTDVYFDGSTYHLFFEANMGGDLWGIGRATASSPGGPYTEAGGNPITSVNPYGQLGASGPCLRKVGSTYHLWMHGQTGQGSGLPSDIYRFTASSIGGPYSPAAGGNPVLRRTESGAGLGGAQDQIAGPKVFEYSGTTYVFYDIDYNPGTSSMICAAKFNGTLAQLTK